MQKNALTFGMTMEQFLYEHPDLFYLYRDYYSDKKNNEYKEQDYFAWQQGVYILQAFRQVFKEAGLVKGGGDSVKYPKKPYNEIQEENTPENRSEMIKARMLARAAQIQQNFDRKNK